MIQNRLKTEKHIRGVALSLSLAFHAALLASGVLAIPSLSFFKKPMPGVELIGLSEERLSIPESKSEVEEVASISSPCVMPPSERIKISNYRVRKPQLIHARESAPVLLSQGEENPALDSVQSSYPGKSGRFQENIYLHGEGVSEGRSESADWQKSYKERVYALIEYAKRYPYLARREGMEGRVVVRFTILPDGKVKNIRIVSPSSYPVLNSDAIAWIKRAQPFPPFPEEADSPSLSLTYGLTYHLKGSP